MLIHAFPEAARFVVRKNERNLELRLEGNRVKIVEGQSEGSYEVFFCFLHPAQIWAPTGIEVKPGDTVRITSVSGAINTAAHRLMEAAEFDMRPPLGWIFSGIPTDVESIRPQDRSNLGRLDKDLGKGALLLGVKTSPDVAVEAIGCFDGVKLKAEIPVSAQGEVVVAVNDALVTDSSVYLREGLYNAMAADEQMRASTNRLYANALASRWGGPDKPTAKDLEEFQKKNFDAVVSTYREMWFDDNIGGYLLMIEVFRAAVNPGKP